MRLKIGRFEIRERLGVGGFGAVYRAHDPVLKREVALKVPRPGVLDSPQAKARFLREPKVAAQLRHPNIVPVFDAGADGQRCYIASAFIEGHTLAAQIEKQRPDFRRAAQIVRNLAEALDYAHRQGVVHRDVKPANVMIDSQGEPMLMDFGLARSETSEEKLTQDGTVMGTPAYMSPEQASSSCGPVGPASDQYGLGVVLYELLCGEAPFDGPPAVLLFKVLKEAPEPPRRKDPAVPRDLETICLKAMSKRSEDRYGDCREMSEDLRRWLSDEPIRARRMGVVERAGKWARRNPVLAALAVAVAILAVVSSASAMRLSLSRQELAGAVEDETHQAKLAEAATAKAEEQRGVAQEKAKAAEEALAKLKEEASARSNAEAEKLAAARERLRIAEDLKKKASQLTETSTALGQAKQQAQAATQEQEKAAQSSSWPSYTERLAVADAAWQKGDFQAALAKLDGCPKQYRGWEWDYLKKLCSGGKVVDVTHQGDAWHGLPTGFSENLKWGLTLSGDKLTVCRLPNLDQERTLPCPPISSERDKRKTSGVPLSPKEPLHLDPSGAFVVADQQKGVFIYSVPTGKQLASFHAAKFLGYTADGQHLALHDGGVRLISLADTSKIVQQYRRAYEAVGFTRDGHIVLLLARRAQNVSIPVNTHRVSELALQKYSLGDPEAQNAREVDLHSSKEMVFERPLSMRLSPDGQRVLVADVVFERPMSMRLSPDGRRVLVADAETSGRSALFDMQTGDLISVFPITAKVISLGPDPKRILVDEGVLTKGGVRDARTGYRRLALWELPSNRPLPHLACLPWLEPGWRINADWTRAMKFDSAKGSQSLRCWSIASEDIDSRQGATAGPARAAGAAR